MIDPVGGGTSPMNFNPNDVNVPQNPTASEAQKAFTFITNNSDNPIPNIRLLSITSKMWKRKMVR